MCHLAIISIPILKQKMFKRLLKYYNFLYQ